MSAGESQRLLDRSQSIEAAVSGQGALKLQRKIQALLKLHLYGSESSGIGESTLNSRFGANFRRGKVEVCPDFTDYTLSKYCWKVETSEGHYVHHELSDPDDRTILGQKIEFEKPEMVIKGYRMSHFGEDGTTGNNGEAISKVFAVDIPESHESLIGRALEINQPEALVGITLNNIGSTTISLQDIIDSVPDTSGYIGPLAENRYAPFFEFNEFSSTTLEPIVNVSYGTFMLPIDVHCADHVDAYEAQVNNMVGVPVAVSKLSIPAPSLNVAATSLPSSHSVEMTASGPRLIININGEREWVVNPGGAYNGSAQRWANYMIMRVTNFDDDLKTFMGNEVNLVEAPYQYCVIIWESTKNLEIIRSPSNSALLGTLVGKDIHGSGFLYARATTPLSGTTIGLGINLQYVSNRTFTRYIQSAPSLPYHYEDSWDSSLYPWEEVFLPVSTVVDTGDAVSIPNDISIEMLFPPHGYMNVGVSGSVRYLGVILDKLNNYSSELSLLSSSFRGLVSDMVNSRSAINFVRKQIIRANNDIGTIEINVSNLVRNVNKMDADLLALATRVDSTYTSGKISDMIWDVISVIPGSTIGKAVYDMFEMLSYSGSDLSTLDSSIKSILGPVMGMIGTTKIGELSGDDSLREAYDIFTEGKDLIMSISANKLDAPGAVSKIGSLVSRVSGISEVEGISNSIGGVIENASRLFSKSGNSDFDILGSVTSFIGNIPPLFSDITSLLSRL
jgi:hypothetical protein